jgi:HK97 family phage portal protein
MRFSDLWRRKAGALQKAPAGMGESQLITLLYGANPQGAADIDETTYLQAYAKSIWTNACTVAIAQDCASVPLKLRQRGSGDDIDKHPLLDLLRKVNQGEDWPWFCGGLISYRLLAGEAFVLLGGLTAKPDAMWLLRPDHLTPNVTRAGIQSWTHKIGGEERVIPVEQVIQFKRFNPTNPFRGQPVIQAAEITLNLDLAVRKYNNSFLRRGAVPPFILTAEGELSKDQAEQIARTWEEKHGGPNNAGKPAVMGKGLKPYLLQGQQKEGFYSDLVAITKREILAAFHVPPIVVADYSDASVLANATVQKQDYWRSTILNREMGSLLGVLNEQLAPRFGDDLELYADEAAMPELQEDEGAVWTRVQAAVGGPFLKINEGREMLGLEPLGPEGDVVLVSPVLMPLGTEPPEPEPAPIALPEADEEEEPEEKEPPPPGKSVHIIPVRHKSLVGGFGSPEHLAHFRAFVSRLEPQIVRMRRTVGDINALLLAEVIHNLEAEAGKGLRVTAPDFRVKAVADEYLFDTNEARRVYVARLLPEETDALADGAARAIAELSGGSFSLERPEVEAWLRAKKLKITTLPETLYDSIKGHLAAGVEQGQTVTEIANRLRELEPTYQRSFAERVARTEIVGANNAGSLECYRQNDVRQKQWSTAEDENVRDDHAEAHEQVRGIDETFVVGDAQMDAPGDQSVGPEQTCNCRCAVLPVVED